MHKALATVLSLFLCLCLTACIPAAEVTPSPTPTATPIAEPTPDPTPTPMLEPTPEPTPSLPRRIDRPRYWSDDTSYSYTSEKLGIRIRFPQAWENYFSIVEHEYVERDMVDQDGNPVEPYTATLLSLEPKDFTLEADGYIMSLALIYFGPKGMSCEMGDHDQYLPMVETAEGTYYCSMDPMLTLWYQPGISTDGAKFAIINEVQGGIMDGRWEIEVLEK